MVFGLVQQRGNEKKKEELDTTEARTTDLVVFQGGMLGSGINTTGKGAVVSKEALDGDRKARGWDSAERGVGGGAFPSASLAGSFVTFWTVWGGGKFLKRERECREFGVFYYCRVVVE